MPLLTRWRPASAAPYMEVALALPDIGRWYVFFLNSYSRLECTNRFNTNLGKVQQLQQAYCCVFCSRGVGAWVGAERDALSAGQRGLRRGHPALERFCAAHARAPRAQARLQARAALFDAQGIPRPLLWGKAAYTDEKLEAWLAKRAGA